MSFLQNLIISFIRLMEEESVIQGYNKKYDQILFNRQYTAP